VPGEPYVYTYDVEFLADAFHVRFGMMIKLVTGFELAGQASHPPRSGVEHVAAGATATVRFPFRARVVPGVYFLNAGVLGIRDEEAGYLHRILDAAIFRVEGPADRITGAADLSDRETPSVEIRPPA
jgi:lipopolysaccharide transport system ATP-binding protein